MPTLKTYLALDRRIWLLAFARAVNTMGLSLVMAFMAIYLVTQRGLSGTTTGIIYLGANVLQAFSQAWAGSFSDRAGRRTTMVVALLARVVCIAALGTLVSIDAPVWAIAVVLYASWIVRGWFEPVAYAAVADLTSPSERVSAFGLQKMGINLGWALGPAIGGLLMHWLDYGTVFFCSAPVILLAALAVARVRDADRVRTERESVIVALRNFSWEPMVVLFLGCALIGGLVHGQLFSTFSLYAKDGVGLDENMIGLLWAINAACVITLQVPAVGLIGRIGTRAALVLAPLLYATGFLGFGIAGGFGMLAASIAVLTVGEVIFEPAQQTAAAELADPDRMGRAMGLLGLMRMLGLACALPIGGAAFDAFRNAPLSMWTVIASIAVTLAVGFTAFAIAGRRRESAC